MLQRLCVHFYNRSRSSYLLSLLVPRFLCTHPPCILVLLLLLLARTCRYRKVRQHWLPTLVLILSACLVGSKKWNAADLHSDAASIAQTHSGATVLNMKCTASGESEFVALGLYQLSTGTAIDGAAGHLDALARARTLMDVVEAALQQSKTQFSIEPSHLLITFFDCFVKDHIKTEHVVAQILIEIRARDGVAALLEIGCAMHKR